jgi:hypothetical protein
MNLRDNLRELDPAVVEKAIGYIADMREKYSCIALSRACGYDGWHSESQYKWAYMRTTWGLIGIPPKWWDKSNRYTHERIQALTDFRDAIIKANKPTLFERLKAWALEPCSYANFS